MYSYALRTWKNLDPKKPQEPLHPYLSTNLPLNASSSIDLFHIRV